MTATHTNARAKSDHPVRPTQKKLEELYGLIDGIEIAMMTTRTGDGSLVSRPMATQERRPHADLWFMTNVETSKIDELVADPHVNLGYYKDRTREYVSVSGIAHVTQDRSRIRELYSPDWKAWLGDQGGTRNGGPDDPRIALIEVQAHSATYLKVDRHQISTLFNVVKGMFTGERVEAGTVGELDERELASG